MNLTVIAGLAAVGVIAAAAPPSSVHSAVAQAPATSALLVAAGEIPGFDPLPARSATHAGRFVRQAGPLNADSRQILSTLKRNGFQFGIQEHLRSSTDPLADAESLASRIALGARGAEAARCLCFLARTRGRLNPRPDSVAADSGRRGPYPNRAGWRRGQRVLRLWALRVLRRRSGKQGRSPRGTSSSCNQAPRAGRRSVRPASRDPHPVNGAGQGVARPVSTEPRGTRADPAAGERPARIRRSTQRFA
jgi:hypothetical protein